MTTTETEAQCRLRRAKEALLRARDSESTARKALCDAVENLAKAKARYESLFMQEEQEEVRRRKSAYYHTTK